VNWSPSDPGAGDVEGIRYVWRLRKEKAQTLRGVSAEVGDVVALAQSGEWVSAAPVSFVAKTGSVLPDLQILSTGLDSQADALNQYASALDHIKDTLRMVAATQRNAEENSTHALLQIQGLPASARVFMRLTFSRRLR